jgi:hypothetical protein
VRSVADVRNLPYGSGLLIIWAGSALDFVTGQEQSDSQAVVKGLRNMTMLKRQSSYWSGAGSCSCQAKNQTCSTTLTQEARSHHPLGGAGEALLALGDQASKVVVSMDQPLGLLEEP